MSKSVIIIGGGITGLAVASFLCGKGYDIKVYESTPKWGGRTYSYYDVGRKIYLDNGQHILAGWYENTFEFLKLIGTYNKLEIKNKLKLTFCDNSKNIYKFKSSNLPGIYSLLSGIFKFTKFSFNDKIKFLKIRNVIRKENYIEENIKEWNVKKLLDEFQQTENVRKYFWNPLILAAFNTTPENVSADLFVKLIKKGTELKKNMSIILTDANLNELFIDKAFEYLKRNSVGMFLNSRVKKINIENNNVKKIEMENGTKEKADFYICAVQNNSFLNLFEKEIISKYFFNVENIKSSTIISVHLFLKEDLNLNTRNTMIGLIDTIVQWVFVKSKRHLCLVISGADFIENNLTEKDNNTIVEICIKDLSSNLYGFDEKNILDFKVIKEKKATFLPEVGSDKCRIRQESDIKNLFIGGDWTDTGYPATIESAVKSAKICSNLVLRNKN